MNQCAFRLPHDNVSELFGAGEAGIGSYIGEHPFTFDLASSRLDVTILNSLLDIFGGDGVGCHFCRVEPDTHGEFLLPENIGAGDTLYGDELRLNDAGEVVGNLLVIHGVTEETKIE